jgi:hypothetical protein
LLVVVVVVVVMETMVPVVVVPEDLLKYRHIQYQLLLVLILFWLEEAELKDLVEQVHRVLPEEQREQIVHLQVHLHK